jgi:hypothetical protein
VPSSPLPPDQEVEVVEDKEVQKGVREGVKEVVGMLRMTS